MISFSNSISVSRLKSCISIVNLRDQFSAPGGRFSWVQLSCMQINRINLSTGLLRFKDVIQGKLFQKCTHLLYCSVLSLGGNVNARRMSKPDMGSIFYIKNKWNILVIGTYYVNYQHYQNLLILTYSDTKRTLMHLFLFRNSAQRELVSMCTQSIHDRK